MREKVTRQVIEIIAEKLDREPAQILPEQSFSDDLRADSLTMAELALAFEEAFDLPPIPDDAVERITTVQAAIQYVVDEKTGS